MLRCDADFTGVFSVRAAGAAAAARVNVPMPVLPWGFVVLLLKRQKKKPMIRHKEAMDEVDSRIMMRLLRMWMGRAGVGREKVNVY